MSNYEAATTIAVSPAPPGLFNVFAVCPDFEIQHGRAFRVEPVVAILLQEVQLAGQRVTQVVFAGRDRNASGLLRSVFDDMAYVATLSQDEIDRGEADRLVAQIAELDALADPESDLAP
jgi:hypothetical protein